MTDLHGFREIIAERKKMVALTVCATMLAALLAALLRPPVYRATAALLLDYDGENPASIGGQAASYGLIDPGEYINTQIDIVKSRAVAMGVIGLLGLDHIPEIVDAWEKARRPNPFFFWKKKADPDIRAWLYDRLLSGNLDVQAAKDSRFIYINFVSADPRFAAAAANAYARAYRNYNLELKVKPFKYASRWLAGNLSQLRDKADEASRALRRYQKKEGIIAGAGEYYDGPVRDLDILDTELAQAREKRREAALAYGRARRCRGRYESLPEVLSNTFIQDLKAKKANLETALAGLEGKVGRKNPRYTRRLSELQAVKARLASEMKNVVHSIRRNYTVADERVQALEAAAARQKGRALSREMSMYRFDSLDTASQVSREAYKAALAKFDESLLNGDMNRTNVFIIDPAVAPRERYGPDLPLNMFLAAIAGLLLGLGLAFFSEYLDDTIKNANTVEALLNVPVLGAIAPASYKQ